MPDGGVRKRSKLKIMALALAGGLLVCLAGLWLAGQIVMGQALALMGLDKPPYEVKRAMVIYLPVAKIVWGRDVSVSRQGRRGPVKVRAASVWGRKFSGADGSVWRLRLGDLSWGREGAWRLTSGGFQLEAAYSKTGREVRFSDGGFETIEFEGGENQALQGSLKSLSFRQLSFAAGLSGNPFDWNLDVGDLAIREFRAQGTPAGIPFDTGRPMSLSFSGHCGRGDWSVDLDLSRPADEGGGPKEAEEKSLLAGLWSKAKDKFDPRAIVDFSSFQLEAAGAWAEADGEASRAKSRWSLDFPGLYQMVLEGESPAPAKGEAASWAAACFKRLRGGSEGAPDCLGALPFTELKSRYEDRKLMSYLERAKTAVKSISWPFGSKGPKKHSEKYALPLLGVDLADWLARHDYPQGSEGEFTFDGQGRPLRPFSDSFKEEILEDGAGLEFVPAK